MNHDEVDERTAFALATMLDLGAEKLRLWQPTELAAILEHQLAAPLEIDLARIDPGLPARLASRVSPGPPQRTFRDLFHHPYPPIELLEITKRFAKRCRTDPEGPLPVEIATLLYFLTIAVALAHAGRKISGLDDESLRGGIQWSLAQPWLDEPTRRLLREGLDAMG